jgi:hypothetical protein
MFDEDLEYQYVSPIEWDYFDYDEPEPFFDCFCHLAKCECYDMLEDPC